MKFSNTSSFAKFNFGSLIIQLFIVTLFCIAFPMLLALLELDFPGSSLLLTFANILIAVLILIVLALNDLIFEFVLCVFIIGTLMMFSVPIYSSYIERAKIAEVIGLMGGMKSSISEYYSYHGRFPTQIEQLDVKTAGKYTSNITLENGAITAKLVTTNQALDGLSLSLRPALPNNGLPKVITWVCGYATPPDGFIVQGDNKTTIPPHYLSRLTCR